MFGLLLGLCGARFLFWSFGAADRGKRGGGGVQYALGKKVRREREGGIFRGIIRYLVPGMYVCAIQRQRRMQTSAALIFSGEMHAVLAAQCLGGIVLLNCLFYPCAAVHPAAIRAWGKKSDGSGLLASELL